MKSAVLWPSGYIMGQYGADGQQGRIKEPTVCVLAACQMHLGIKQGEQTQWMSPPQSQVKAFTASVSGHHHLELNQASCEFSWLVNRWIVSGPIACPAGRKSMAESANRLYPLDDLSSLSAGFLSVVSTVVQSLWGSERQLRMLQRPLPAALAFCYQSP